MAQTTVRITEQTHAALRALARDTDRSMQDVLAEAVEAYRRRRFLERVNEGYAAVRRDPAAWREVQAERAGFAAADDEALQRADPPPMRRRPAALRPGGARGKPKR